MRKLQTEILVIGGGATGTGIVRDLAMRGFKTVLVEKRDFSHGTTGRYHGLLHSGGRYAVKDPLAAKECIEENVILRRIMPHCLEDTGGFFVTTPWDDPSYAPKFAAGCQAAGIPIEEISISQMLKEEPLLNPNITRCFRVPDGSADSFMASEMNVKSAQQYGAEIRNYHQVTRLLREGDRVVGAVCHDLVKDEEVAIHADMVVNASGAWAGQIAATIGLEIRVVPGKGTMVAINHRVINTVVNRARCRTTAILLSPFTPSPLLAQRTRKCLTRNISPLNRGKFS
jgi:glycerol-3-phosphate dehydrogenase